MAAPLRVLDTSAWIEWLVASSVDKKLAKEIPDKDLCIVPTIVQPELSKWLWRELGESQADQVSVYTMKCQVMPLDPATAVQQKAELLTCAPHFEGLPGVVLLPKSPAH